MKDEVPFSDFPAYTERSKGKPKAAVIFLIILILIAAGLGGLYFLGKNSGSTSPATTVAPTEAPVEEPTATPEPTPELDRSELTVSVLNGSGARGAAGGTAEILRNLGYTLGTTGNAENFNYEGITIIVSEESEEYLDLLKSDLEKEASASAVTASVSATLNSGAQVIVGK